MKKIITSTLLASLMFLGPLAASADTSTSTQVQTLLTQLQTLQAQLQALQTAQINVSSTLQLIRSLRQGMSGADVSALQAILAADPSIYPQGTISGFFGRLTAEAVKKFQKKHGIDPLGLVGPKTLKKLNDEAGNLGLSEENDDATSTSRDNEDHSKRLCAKVPPGHLIAQGWLRKNGDVMPVIPTCQILPPGIMMKLHGDDNEGHGTTTPPDVTAPIISSLVATPLATSTTVSWTTNELASGKVWFGTTTPMTLISNSAFSTSHSFTLAPLATSTTYNYIVVSSDTSGNTATSSQNSFTTLAQ